MKRITENIYSSILSFTLSLITSINNALMSLSIIDYVLILILLFDSFLIFSLLLIP